MPGYKVPKGYIRAQENAAKAIEQLDADYIIASEKGKTKACKKLLHNIEKKKKSIARIDDTIAKAKEDHIEKQLKKINKKNKRDRTPYRMLVVRSDSIIESSYNKIKYGDLVRLIEKKRNPPIVPGKPIKDPAVWSEGVRYVSFGKAEAVIIDMCNHIDANSSSVPALSDDDRHKLAELMNLDQRSSSFVVYSSLVVLAGVVFGFSFFSSTLWIIKYILFEVALQ